MTLFRLSACLMSLILLLGISPATAQSPDDLVNLDHLRFLTETVVVDGAGTHLLRIPGLPMGGCCW